jgi:hypothetical protein
MPSSKEYLVASLLFFVAVVSASTLSLVGVVSLLISQKPNKELLTAKPLFTKHPGITLTATGNIPCGWSTPSVVVAQPTNWQPTVQQSRLESDS